MPSSDAIIQALRFFALSAGCPYGSNGTISRRTANALKKKGLVSLRRMHVGPTGWITDKGTALLMAHDRIQEFRT